MNKVKYQIFVSSTYDDLKEERDQVIKACLEMGHIPVGMEMFSAADEEQWQIITRQIDESDYYVIIVANRYGSMVEGISYTEKEYDYAVSKGIPTLGFVLDAKAAWPSDRLEADKKARTKLEAFKKKVKEKPVNFWSSKEDLHGKCAIALGKTFNTQPRPGWVRSPEATSTEVMAEFSRLSSENNNLREEVAALRKAADTSEFAQGEDTVELVFYVNYIILAARIAQLDTWSNLFLITAKSVLNNPTEYIVKDGICAFYKKKVLTLAYSDNSSGFKDYDTFQSNVAYGMYDDQLETIKIQFVALNLIRITNSGNSHNIWTLTEEGERYLASIAAKRRTDTGNDLVLIH